MPGFLRRGPEIDLDLAPAEADLLVLALPALELTPPPGPAMGPRPAHYPHFRAHPGDEAAEAGFRDLTGGILASDRAADRRRFAASLERGTLGPEDAAAWLRVLGEARLALAARLGVAAEGWDAAPPSPGLALLHLFGCVQAELATLLLADG